MPDEIISMTDMNVIFGVTDKMGIHRESVTVDLTKEDPGLINQPMLGKINITIPLSMPLHEFSELLRVELESMGFTETDDNLNEDEDDY
jgi:hypothetical protein|tara:strand:- start:378 stop:644 length:267 start_codon:yes stop_codon:yes gene_type:complete